MPFGGRARLWVFLLILYVLVDFMSPFMLGAFCFDNENLFVDGAIEVSTNARLDLFLSVQLPGDEATRYRHESVQADTSPLRHQVVPTLRWGHLRQKLAVSYRSSPPLDPSLARLS